MIGTGPGRLHPHDPPVIACSCVRRSLHSYVRSHAIRPIPRLAVTYALFFILAAATGLTALLIPAALRGDEEASSTVLGRYPLVVLMGTWVVVFVLIAVTAA